MKKKELKLLYSMMYPDYPDIVGVTELQEMLDVSRAVAYRLLREGDIKGKIVAGAYKIPKFNVINFVTDDGLEGMLEKAKMKDEFGITG